MSLLDQLRLLDRALRDIRVREALRTGDRGGRRLARFAGSVAPADLAILRAVDARRFEAVAQRQAEMIRDRWWTPRFPGVLAGTARAMQGTTRDVAQGAMASPAFDKREGEDETGSALLGFVIGREDRSADPEWLADLAAYEYLVAVGLPRRARALKLDLSLEQQLLPQGTRFLESPSPKSAGKGSRAGGDELSVARNVVILPLEFPASDIHNSLQSGQSVPDEVEAEPHVVVFVTEPEGAIELRVPAVAHDLLDMIGAAPIVGARLLETFEAEDREAAHTALRVLSEAGVIKGTLPELVPPAAEETPRARRKGPEPAKPAPNKSAAAVKRPAPAKKPLARKQVVPPSTKSKKRVAIPAGRRKVQPKPARRR